MGRIFRLSFLHAVLVVIALPVLARPALADLTICNNALFPVAVAIAYQDPDKGWVSSGWWGLNKLSCETLITGPLNGRTIYTYAEGVSVTSVKNWWWGENMGDGRKREGERLCILPRHDQHFAIYKEDVKGTCEASGYTEIFFTKLNTASFANYTLGLGYNSPLAPPEERQLQAGDFFWECDGCPKMVVVPAGRFMMGSVDNEPGRRGDEAPRHSVSIGGPFAISELTITRDEFERFLGATAYKVADACLEWKDGAWTEQKGASLRNPGFPQAGNHPAVCVSYDDAKAYIAWLSKQSGRTYRLATEAEWEYAIRAGTETPFWWGSSISGDQANYNASIAYAGGAKGEFRKHTIAADATKANPWKVYGPGNAADWVEDCWNTSYAGAPSDGSAWTKGNCALHAVRGGSWASDPAALRSAARQGYQAGIRSADIGFRVARSLMH